MDKKIAELLFEAIDIVNKQLKDGDRLPKSGNTALIGKDSQLDSLGILNFITTTEELIEEAFDADIALMENEDILFSEDGPLRSIDTLSKYISDLLKG